LICRHYQEKHGGLESLLTKSSPCDIEVVKKMPDNFSDIGEAIRKASEAYAQAISAVSKALQNIVAQATGTDRDRLIENWLRVARMSKDGLITAIEQAYEFFEREVRRSAAGTTSAKAANPVDAWAENWRKATEAFSTGNWSKQAETVQKILTEGIHAWQRMWEPEKK
jgi:DNA-binding FadR family transcriptional regulator